MSMKRVGIIGHFGFGKDLANGQTIKTKIVTDELGKLLGKDEIHCVDTHMSKKQLLSLPFILWKTLKTCRNIVILPAHNGLRIIAPLLIFENAFFHRKLHYVVIGGWLPVFLNKRNSLVQKLKKFNGIYVETNTMKNALEQIGFQNIILMPNCKELKVLKKDELIYNTTEPYLLCTFSRVDIKKGIEDAVNIIKTVNTYFGRTVYMLDIYGPIDSGQTEWFNNLQKYFSPYVTYRGIVSYDKSVEVLKNYFALLFPTKYFTEGIPGTIIDAYAAGLPVISSKWQSFNDIIEDGVTGIGYEFNNSDELMEILMNPTVLCKSIEKWKYNCLAKSVDFLPNKVVGDFIKYLD